MLEADDAVEDTFAPFVDVIDLVNLAIALSVVEVHVGVVVGRGAPRSSCRALR